MSSNPFAERGKAEEDPRKKKLRKLGVVAVLLACTGFLLWNETAYIKRMKTISDTVELPIGNEVDPSMEGRNVFVCGRLKASAQYSDESFNFMLNSPKVIRKVEYFQRLEHKKEIVEKNAEGIETKRYEYSYDFGWIDKPQTQEFHKEKNTNTVRKRVVDSTYTDRAAKVGPYKLSADFLDEVNPVPLTLTIKTPTPRRSQEVILLHVDGNQIFLGKDPKKPEVGDLRVTYTGVPADTVTFLARLQNGVFVTSGLHKEKVFRLGAYPFESTISTVRGSQSFFMWMIRVIITLFTAIFLGMLLGKQKGGKFGLAFWGAIVLASTVASIPWMKYAGLGGNYMLIPLFLSIIVGLVILLVRLFRKKRAADPQMVVDPNSATAYGVGPEFKGWLN